MKRALLLALLTALLGGCVVTPYGYRNRDDDYRGHGYYRGDGYYHGYSYDRYGYREREHGS